MYKAIAMPYLLPKNDIYNYLKNNSPPPKSLEIQQWLANPANEKYAKEILFEYYCSAEFSNAPKEINDLEDIYQAIIKTTQLPKPKTINLGKYRYLLSGAVAAAVATVLYFTVFYIQEITVKTNFGEIKTITLPDGSKVTLNSNSTLKYPSSWSEQDDREVVLDGEAFFSVKHLPNHKKFKVATHSSFKVEVLGTEFSIYKRHGNAEVVLNSGKIKIDFADAQTPDFIMVPNELIKINNETKLIAKERVNAVEENAWKDKKIVLRETTMTELRTILKENFNVDLVIASESLQTKLISGTLPANDKKVLVEALETILQIKILQQDSTITFLEQ